MGETGGPHEKPPLVKIGRFEVLGKLGQGGFGTVYKGRDPAINRLAAIKVVHQSVLNDSGLLERFRREAESAGNLSHPNIVTIYELGEHEGQPFIAMEYLEGRDLGQLLGSRHSLPMEQRIDILTQVAEALDFAHKNGVIHRDVKPANVRVLKDGRVKIVDFGIAKVADSEMTRSGLVMGTVHYMAPEQLQRHGRVDGRTDQYALGVTAYELLAHRRPHDGDISQVLYAIAHELPPPLHELQGTPYAWLDPIVRRAMEKDPARRWPSCRDLADALRRRAAVSDYIATSYLQRPEDPQGMPVPATSAGQPLVSLPTMPRVQASSGGYQVAVQTPPLGTAAGITPSPDRAPMTGPAAQGYTSPPAGYPSSPSGYATAAAYPPPSGAQGAPPYGPPPTASAAYAPPPGGPPGTGYSYGAAVPPATAPVPAASRKTPLLFAAVGALIAAGVTVALLGGRSRPLEVPLEQPEQRAVVPAPPAQAPAPAAAPVAAPMAAEVQPSAAPAGGTGAVPATTAGETAGTAAVPPVPEPAAAEVVVPADGGAPAAAAAAPAQRPEEKRARRLAERAQSLERQGDVAGALAAWRELSGIDPKWPGARDAVARLEGRVETTRTEELATQVRRRLRSEALPVDEVRRQREALASRDAANPLVAELDRLATGLTRARAALERMAPAEALEALHALDSTYPAVAELHGRAQELGRKREQGEERLARARDAQKGGYGDEARRLTREASALWPPLAAEAERLLAASPAATATPHVAPPVPAAPEDPRPRIEQVLGRYAEALEKKDLAALRAVWPGISTAEQKKVQDSFSFIKNHDVALTVERVDVNGDTARASCLRHDRIETRDGQSVDNSSRPTFVLRRTGAAWVIDEIR